MAWKIIERTCIVLGMLFTGVCAYYAVATYYGGNLPKTAPEPNAEAGTMTLSWLLYIVSAIGVALIITGWVMMLVRRRDHRRQSQLMITSPPPPEVPQLIGDITASDAYFKILEHSEWTKEQRRITTDTTNLRRDWLAFRLSKEIHAALRNSKLEAWGEECLHGMQTTPPKPIPAVAWDTVEISFDDRPQFTRTAAYEKGPTTFQPGRQAWIDVKLSSRQIFAIFPLANTSEWKPIHLAIDHISQRIGDTDASGCYPTARRELRQRAYDKKVKLRGRKQLVDRPIFRKDEYSEIHTDVDPQYWITSEINALATSADPRAQNEYHAVPQTAFAWGPKGLDERNRYAQLLVEWPDILREWPQ
jgi:hypothetical protein